MQNLSAFKQNSKTYAKFSQNLSGKLAFYRVFELYLIKR